jgi:hypothetical protein
MSNDIVSLINKISEMTGETILEKMLDYCESYDKEPQELGDLLQENEDFKKLLYRDCVKHNIIKDSTVQIPEDLEKW